MQLRDKAQSSYREAEQAPGMKRTKDTSSGPGVSPATATLQPPHKRRQCSGKQLFQGMFKIKTMHIMIIIITRDTPCANDLAPRMSSLVPWPLRL